MGIVTKKINEIQKTEKLTIKQVFEKYPFLAELQHEEMLKEQGKPHTMNEKQLKLLLG